MDDEELRHWGEYGRNIGPTTAMYATTPPHDPFALWNAFGALEAKVREMESKL